MKTICDSCLAQSPVNGVHLTHCGHVLFKEEKPDIVVFARQQLAERDKAIARAAYIEGFNNATKGKHDVSANVYLESEEFKELTK